MSAVMNPAVQPLRGMKYGMALALFGVLLWPGTRQWMEAQMTRHMLLQFPLLMVAGALLAAALPDAWRRAAARWNDHGISGLFAVALILGVLMIPRVLDLALVDPAVETAKCLALVVCGAALYLSWRPAGWLVQGFFLGNLLPMMVVAGSLYESSPVRVCNAYLLDDQVQLGRLLVGLAAATALLWLTLLVRALMSPESGSATPSLPPATGSAGPGSR